MKKNIFLKRLAIVCLSLVTVTSVCACGNSETEGETPEEVVEENDEVEEEIEEEPLTEEDLDGLLEGVENHYVLQDAKDVDYMHGVEYNTTVEMTDDESENSSEKSTETTETETPKKTKVIHKVTVDNSKVDASTPGTYKVTYTVQVNRKAYNEYVAQKDVETPFDSDDADKETDESAETEKDTDSNTVEETEADGAESDNEADTTDETDNKEAEADDTEDEDVDEDDLEDVIIEKDIEIVDKDEAEKLVEDGQEVWTDENKDYGEVLEEEKKQSESSSNNSGENNSSTDGNKDASSSNDNKDASDNAESSSSGNSNSGSSSSGSSSSGSSSSGSSSSGSSSSGSSSSGSSSGNSSSSSAGSNSSSSSSSSKSCDHNWVATYHEATGHYESVKVQDAYDEKVCTGQNYICNRCGYTTTSVKEIGSHCSKVCGGTYYSQNIYETVHHDAVYEQKWVQDSAAYTTYKCSKCGATK